MSENFLQIQNVTFAASKKNKVNNFWKLKKNYLIAQKTISLTNHSLMFQLVLNGLHSPLNILRVATP